MKKKATIWWVALMAAGLSSCEKGDYVKSYHEFVDVYFDPLRTALRSNPEGVFIAMRYNGAPIDWNAGADGKVRVVEGEGTFEFYDTRNNQVVCDTTVNVIADGKQVYYLFQPTMDAPVTFIDPDGQASEETAPDGHIKLRIANYAQDLIPFAQTDIKVFVKIADEEWNETVVEVGTISNLAGQIDEAAYVTLPYDVPDGTIDYQYYFEFVDSATGEPLLDYGGSPYRTSGFSPGYLDPLPVKNVFTLYLTSLKAWGEAPPFIKKGDDFYEVAINVLYAD
ncbi:hypothetical protein [Parapedobacter tibetensis]|uniref:hypothetical protein n=1 Tax=Parapedobacter tibetensis TaxID=2972951 RepID=UPI00214D8E7E|nr:hypothetical protein [Parapedobacter tibetensis]